MPPDAAGCRRIRPPPRGGGQGPRRVAGVAGVAGGGRGRGPGVAGAGGRAGGQRGGQRGARGGPEGGQRGAESVPIGRRLLLPTLIPMRFAYNA
jgi:hypothetical protein